MHVFCQKSHGISEPTRRPSYLTWWMCQVEILLFPPPPPPSESFLFAENTWLIPSRGGFNKQKNLDTRRRGELLMETATLKQSKENHQPTTPAISAQLQFNSGPLIHSFINLLASSSSSSSLHL